MALDDRVAFKVALLEHRTEDEWRQHRPDHLTFYRERVPFEGRERTYEEIIKTYAEKFPADRNYSVRAHLNRMLADCEVPQFSFTDPEVIRGFLLSAKSPSEWSKYQPNARTFEPINFHYHGISLMGQMLLHNVFVGLENEANGTYYAVIDYQDRPELNLSKDRSPRFIVSLFDRVGIKVKSKHIKEAELTPERLREILLARRSEKDWNLWQGKSSDFESTWFDLEGFRNFTGTALIKRYEELRHRKYSAKDIFSEADISVASDPDLLRKRVEDRFERLYGALEDPSSVRQLFLQIQNEEEWRKPQRFTNLRGKRVAINGDRSITVHTLLHLYGMHKYNSAQEDVNNYIGFDGESQEKFSGVIASNKKELGELLDFAGLEVKFVPNLGEVDLHDPSLLRRMLFHANYEGRDLSPTEISEMPAANFRKVRMHDPSTGIDITGQSLMIFYSALHYVNAHPGVGLNEAANGLNQGKSNQAVKDEILEKAEF